MLNRRRGLQGGISRRLAPLRPHSRFSLASCGPSAPAETLDGAALHLALDAQRVDGAARVLDHHEVVQGELARVGVDLDARQLRREGRAPAGRRPGRLTPRTGGTFDMYRLPFLPIWAKVITRSGHAADGHPAVLDLEVVDRRLELLGGDLERLPPGVLGGLQHRRADRVDGLAAGAQTGDGGRRRCRPS